MIPYKMPVVKPACSTKGDGDVSLGSFQDHAPHVGIIPIMLVQVSPFGCTMIWYGNGFLSLVMIGGMWSRWYVVLEIICITAFWRLVSIVRRIRARSVRRGGIVQYITLKLHIIQFPSSIIM